MNMVAMEDGDFVMALHPATMLHQMKTSASRCVLIDCRSYIAFNSSRVKTSLNINCPPILKRRLHRGSASLNNIVICSESRERLEEADKFILYDDRTSDWRALENDNTMKIIASVLKRERNRKIIYFLQGGFELFSSTYPSMCDYSKPPQQSHSLTSPLALKLRGDAKRISSRSTHCEVMEKEKIKSIHELTEREPVEILPYLYLGSESHASQKEVLKQLGISAIMNVSRTIPCYFEDTFTYKTIPVDDSYSADIGSWFEEAVIFIDSIKSSKGRVLVHCHAGISRSATICLAYLISRLHYRLDEAYEFVKTRRSIISPNFNFMGQLLSWESSEIKASVKKLNSCESTRESPKCTNSGSNFGFQFSFSPFSPCSSEFAFFPGTSTSSPPPGLVTTT